MYNSFTIVFSSSKTRISSKSLLDAQLPSSKFTLSFIYMEHGVKTSVINILQVF